jgi:hypothetical protein
MQPFLNSPDALIHLLELAVMVGAVIIGLKIDKVVSLVRLEQGAVKATLLQQQGEVKEALLVKQEELRQDFEVKHAENRTALTAHLIEDAKNFGQIIPTLGRIERKIDNGH